MKITGVSYERLDLKLSSPYTIAYETVEHTTNFILTIETDSRITGYGCSAPDVVVTGETPAEVEQVIRDTVVPFLKGKDPFFYGRILEDLRTTLPENASTLAMVDMALLDLVSRKAGVPLYKYLGGFRDEISTSVTIGILPREETIKQARELVANGFSILKRKGGANLEEDVEKMILLRENFPHIMLRFDGNQGYSADEAIAFVKRTHSVGIEIFEQPTRIGNEIKLGEVTSKVDLPVMADESLKTLTDAFRLASNERVDMVNIKLMKVGGIMEGLNINSVARAANLEAMVGCIDECGLGIAAGLHFALARPNIHYADLDGHLDILNDPFKKLVRLEKGVLYPSEHPGLGKISGL
jgi:L-alanine-DL-glutamate epimerase-like enolase superfamily enzyme